jgi:hypothetical protein
MKKTFNILLSFGLFLVLASCESDYGQFNRDNRPEIPLMFTNATSFGFNPYIEIVDANTSEIKFEMEIPANSGRTIKEITAVGAGATAIQINSLNTNFITAPIPGEGNKAVFQTTLGEFRQKRPTVAINPPAVGFSEIAFIFLVTLDNGDQIVSMGTRVRVKRP